MASTMILCLLAGVIAVASAQKPAPATCSELVDAFTCRKDCVDLVDQKPCHFKKDNLPKLFHDCEHVADCGFTGAASGSFGAPHGWCKKHGGDLFNDCIDTCGTQYAPDDQCIKDFCNCLSHGKTSCRPKGMKRFDYEAQCYAEIVAMFA